MRLLTRNLLAACGLTLGLAACEGDTNTATTPGADTSTSAGDATTGGSDAATTGGSDTATTGGGDTATTGGSDTSSQADAGGGGDTGGATGACDREGVTLADTFFNVEDEYQAFGASSETQAIIVEFYDFGDGLPLDGPGTYPLGDTEDDRNYETCATCALIYDECTDDGCGKTFFATEGSIEVTAIDPDARTVTARIVDAKFVEVTIDEDFVSTPVDGGDLWCVEEFAIDAEPECTKDADCTEAGKGVCDTENFVCVECLADSSCTDPSKPYCFSQTGTCAVCTSSFQCTTAAPVCMLGEDEQPMCSVVDACTGDDAGENGDDGPLGAVAITLGETKTAKICGDTDAASNGELDFYSLDLAAAGKVTITLTWTGDSDLDVFVVDAQGEDVDASASDENPEVITFADLDGGVLPAGRYFILVNSYAGNPDAAIDYSLQVVQPTP